MANPNIVNVTSIYGKTVTAALTTSATAIVANGSSSGKVLKINAILVANIDGTAAADVTIAYGPSGSTVAIASTISVPADSTLTIIDKSTAIYVEENNSIWGTASANGDLVITISYEEIA